MTDLLMGGGLDYLTDFLEKNDCDLLFLNYRFFDATKKEVSIKGSECIKRYEGKQDIVTTDRNLFMRYASHSITFISASVVKTSLVTAVKGPERYFGTNFIHTYIMLEAIKEKPALFGVVMQPLIEDNAVTGDSEMSKHSEMFFTVWCKQLYTVLCVHAVECGFQRRLMRKVYLQYLHDWPLWPALLHARRQRNNAMIDNFWKDGYPVVKKYPNEWIKAMAIVLVPQCILDICYEVLKSLKKALRK